MLTKVLLADDHDVVRAGLRAIIERQPNLEVVGEAHDGREAVELAKRLEPDLVLMDISMPELNGIEATRQMKADGVEARVIILSMHGDRRSVGETIRAGASGYLLKNAAARELPMAIRAVAVGKAYISPQITDQVLEDYARYVPTEGDGLTPALTAREREVLQLLAEGKTSKEIAAALFLSVKTIESHRGQIMDKLGIRTIAELTKFAIREGLTSVDF